MATNEIAKALPLVKRALKVLSEREVTPQLGLLKSTLLQLDSTFSERNFGASTFRDFMEKVAAAGVVVLRQSGRSMLVEATEDVLNEAVEPMTVTTATAETLPPVAAAPVDEDDEESLPQSPMSMQDGIRAVQQALGGATRWPMYVRQAKQFLKNTIEGFDERKYGFASVVDLLRAAGKEGVLRIERDRQGAIRVFPGEHLQPKTTSSAVDESVDESAIDAEVRPLVETLEAEAEAVSDQPIVDVVAADVTGNVDVDAEVEYVEPGDVNGNIAGIDTHDPAPKAARKRKNPPRAKSPSRSAAPAPAPAAVRRGGRKPVRRQKADAS